MEEKAYFSHKKDHWATPKNIYNYFMKNEYIDPCPLKCETNNLEKDFGNNNLFINPPYSDTKSWIDFTLNHLRNHKHNFVTLLIPIRSDTKYFHKLVESEFSCHIWFIKGRLHFNESKSGAPFPSILIQVWMKPTKTLTFSTINKDTL